MAESRHTMSVADAAWLHMDSRTNPMVVNSLVMLESIPAFEAVRERLATRLAEPYPRFRQRVVDPPGQTPAFEDDPDFDVRNHLHRLALPAPGGRAALEEAIGDLIAAPLDPGKPLWHAYLIEVGDGSAALLWRIHHSIADGIALAQVLLSLSDGQEGPAIEPEHERHPHGLLGRVAAAPLQAASAARSAAGVTVREVRETVGRPEHLRELGEAAVRDAATAAKLVGSPADPDSGLRRPLSGTRGVAWSRPLPLEELKEACHRRGVKLNDMLLAALAATIADNVEWGRNRPERMHAMVPVNLRPLSEPVPAGLGNDFALVLLDLPLGELRSAERLRRVADGMNAIKGSIEAPLSFGLLNVMGAVPHWLEDQLVGFFSDKASMVVTNVPGPAEKLSFAGVPIERVLVWAPCSGSIGMTVSIFSYAGQVTVGFMADTALAPDPTVLARGFAAELRRLA